MAVGRVIVLNELFIDSKFDKQFLVIGLGKETAFVAKSFWGNQQNALDFSCFDHVVWAPFSPSAYGLV